MNLTISNTVPLVAADPRVAGAAVKILMAGGKSLSDPEARRAAGLSGYMWTTHRNAIMDLVAALEA